MMIGEPTPLVLNLQNFHWEDPSHASMRAPPSPSPLDVFSLHFSGNAGGCDYPTSIQSSTAFHRNLSNDFTPTDLDTLCEDFDMSFDAFSGDHFRMFEFKVRKCARGRSHDWTECSYAHPSEKACRRDPRKYHYSGIACPEFRKGICNKGDSCEFAHGVFECWLHPSRYRTQLCKEGTNCRRRVCFFAHNPEQLRFFTHRSGESSDGSPIRHGFDSSWSNASFVSSPTSVLNSSPIFPLSDSPPTSPGNPQYGGGSFNAVSEIATSMRNVQVDKVPSTRGSQTGSVFGSPRCFPMGSVFGSPRGSNLRPGDFGLPSTPTRAKMKSGLSPLDIWDQSYEEEPAMERVESGRELRAKMYTKLSKENSFGRSNTGLSVPPDFGSVK